MALVKVDIPEELFEAAALNRPNASRDVSCLLALSLFNQGTVSLGRAAELCQTPLESFMQFAASRGVGAIQYGHAELETDRRTSQRLGF
jgi:predicted HTH domain antitoxin